MIPDSVSVPPVTERPPLPAMMPAKVVAPLLIVSVLVPSVTAPLPDNVLIEAPAVVPEISKVPLSATPLEAAMLPEPLSAKVPAEIVVAPL